MKYTRDFLDKIYYEIINDTSIKSVSEIGRSYGLSPKQCQTLSKKLFEIYDRDYILSITRSRLAKYANTIRNSKKVVYSEESKQRMSVAQKLRFETDEKSKEISRQNMIKYCAPKSRNPESRKKAVQTRIDRYGKNWCSEETKKRMSESQKGRSFTDETRKRMSESAIKRGYCKEPGWTQSDEVKKKLSEYTKIQWERGDFDTFRFRSKLQIEIAECIKNMGYEIIEEYRIKGKPYDIFIKEKNLLIEVNGTYWHYDNRFYESGFYDKSKKRFVDDIWKRDKNKLNIAKNEGYDIEIIWQYDWENKDKHKLLQEVLNEY